MRLVIAAGAAVIIIGGIWLVVHPLMDWLTSWAANSKTLEAITRWAQGDN